jgi:hypothetical protein
LNVKLSCTSDEIESFEAMDDAELAALVRESLKAFRGKRSGAETEAQDDDLENATTRGVTGGPREGGRVAQDAAARATHDAALKAHERNVADAEQTREIEKFIPGYGRL